MKHLHRDRRRSYAALFLACLFLVGRLAGDLHLASVRHAICPEHGELIDVAAHGEHALEPTRDDCGERSGVCEVVPAPGADEHGHCVLAQLERERPCSLDLVPVRAVVPECAEKLADEPRRLIAVGIPRFLLAPKHSPPAERTIG